jgi:DHA1 family tetracycline resistance protein-like MFS transporter
LLRICTSLFLAGQFLALFASGAIGHGGALILALGGATLCMPVLNAMTSRRGGVDDRGRLLGAASAAAGVGRVAGPIIAGGLLTFGRLHARLGAALADGGRLLVVGLQPLGNGANRRCSRRLRS